MTVTITAANLRAIAPHAKGWIVDGIVAHQALLDAAGIRDTTLRLAHFLAQSAQETAGFTRLEENLTYTTAARIRAVWPSRFTSTAAAQPFVRNPQALANKVYGGRYGNTGPDDGWLYRGSGCKMTTFKGNYAEVERDTGLPVVANPEQLRQFPTALEAAVIYWKNRDIVALADRDDIVAITKVINGGTTGLADRRMYLARARRVAWGGASASAPVAIGGETGTVTAGLLNLRDAPNGRKIGTMPRGTRLNINGREGSWLNVTAPGPKAGWAAAAYIEVD